MPQPYCSSKVFVAAWIAEDVGREIFAIRQKSTLDSPPDGLYCSLRVARCLRYLHGNLTTSARDMVSSPYEDIDEYIFHFEMRSAKAWANITTVPYKLDV